MASFDNECINVEEDLLLMFSSDDEDGKEDMLFMASSSSDDDGSVDWEGDLSFMASGDDGRQSVNDESSWFFKNLQQKACFIRILLRSRGGEHNNNDSIEEGSGSDLQDLLNQIRIVFQDVDQDLRGWGIDLHKISSEERFGWYMDYQLSRFIQRLERLNPDIQQVYDILSKDSSSRFITGMSYRAVMKSLNSFLKNTKNPMKWNAELISPLMEELEAAQRSLRFLRNFLGFVAKRCSHELGELKVLVNHAEFLVRNMACLFYLCSSVNEEMNDWMVNKIKLKFHLSSVLQKFSPAQLEVREIYTKALKASISKSTHADSAVVDKFGLGFLESLRDYILELSESKLNFVASDKHEILAVHQDLQFLIICFAIYKSSESKELKVAHWIPSSSVHCTANVHSIKPGIPNLDQHCSYFMEHISTVIIDMGCLICSLHNSEQTIDEAMELKKAVSDLDDIVKFAKQDVRKAYEMHIPKSWQLKTKFQTTNARGIACSLMRILEKIRFGSFGKALISQALEHQLNPYNLPPYLSEVLQEKMQSLIRIFSEFTSKPHIDIELRLNDIRNMTRNFLSSFSPGFWSHSLLLFILTEEIYKILRESEDLDSQMMHNTSNYAKEIGDNLINEAKEPPSLPTNMGMHGIEDHGNHLDLICPMEDEATALRLQASFLKVFQSCKGKWHIEDENLKLLLTLMCSGFQSADQDLQSLLSDLNVQISSKKWFSLPLLSSVVSRLSTPTIREFFSIVSRSSRFITSISYGTLIQNLNTLLENIDTLLKCNIELVSPLTKELEGVQNSLSFLRNFLGFTAKRCSQTWGLKDLIIHAEFLLGYMSCLLCLCCGSERMNDEIVNEMKIAFSSVLQMFGPTQKDVRETYTKALKASKSAEGSSIMLDEFDMGFLGSLRDDIHEVSNTDLSFTTFNEDQVFSLQEELNFFMTFFAMDRCLKEFPEYPISNYFFECINDLIIDIGCVIYSLGNDEKCEKIGRELNKKVSDLVASIMDVKEAARRMYGLLVPMSLRSDFPRTNAEGFIASLLCKLKELLNTKADIIAPLEHHIEIVQKKLLSLRDDFGRISKKPSHHKEIHSQWTRFVDIAYQAEFIIDSFLAKDLPLYYHKLGLLNVIEDIKRIKMELKATGIKMIDENIVHKPSCSSTRVSVESSFQKNNVLSSKERLADDNSTIKLVIFGEEAEKIREQLKHGSKMLSIISIVGMPGIGKTTLAESVFQHSSVTYHFHAQARSAIGQIYNKRRLLLEILQEVTAESKLCGDDNDLGKKLYQSLKCQRYLILLDDIWDDELWNDIRPFLPDDENGSRIIFTSRFDYIASKTGLKSINYRLSPISRKKSWEMLKVKLFGNQSCPQELESVGSEIAANCKGLPLTIDLVAGFLRVKETYEWQKVAESLMTLILKDPTGRCQTVLELSYQNLPDDLKPCFLYFAAFPEDANVPARDLILLWIAEGFIQLEEGDLRSLEDVAEDILNNLISRSLVTVSKRRPLGGVDASHVHDLIHEFVVAKAQKEGFMLKISSTLYSVRVHDQWREQYRLCIYHDSWRQFLESNPSGPRTRALINLSAPIWVSFSLNFWAFKLLRVLYIPKVRSYFCSEMFTLIHLRVLVIDTFLYSDAVKIVSKIHKLQNLESFIMERALSGKPHVYLLLDKIFRMMRLRHFYFGGYISFQYRSEKIWELSSLFDNLRTFHHLRASYEEDIEKILKLMPNLVELKALFYSTYEANYTFPKLDFLKKLESLEVTHQEKYACNIININFPPCLKKLVLSNFCMPWTEISVIGNLEYLEILELKHGAFKGPKWDMVDGQFPNLRYLSFDSLDIKEWSASEDHISGLEQLCVATCANLEELPSCLKEINNLQVIRLHNCSFSVANSAWEIKEEQEDRGNEELVIEIY